ncbi:MAG TPA: heme-binding protein, partial [Paracoccus sp.]|nr:heme-binding protein [Paracoccus sp. (in: a-proteobacteria)]
MDLSLDDARKMADNCLEIAAEMTLKPITVAVLDAAGDLKVLLRQDGTSTLRPDIAQGKARGAIALGMGSRAIYERAKEQPYFIQSMNALSGGSLVPVPGGVLIRRDGAILGAVGITGDTSDNDEACASRAIE